MVRVVVFPLLWREPLKIHSVTPLQQWTSSGPRVRQRVNRLVPGAVEEPSQEAGYQGEGAWFLEWAPGQDLGLVK